MPAREYSKDLGIISDSQFQAVLDRFGIGRFVQAEPVPFGLFGQNIFLTSTQGEYVLRGNPHFPWQFPTEQFYARQLHERTPVPVPWPYLLDLSKDIFGWNYVIMPRLPGLQLAVPMVKDNLGVEDRRGIARAMGENLARSSGYNDRTTAGDIKWVEELIALALDALAVPCEPCFLMEDYKEQNVVVGSKDGTWHVSGVFDLMEGHFGDGEADLSRTVAMYFDVDPRLVHESVQAYAEKKALRPGFAERFPIYMLLDRLIIWEYFQRNGNVPWNNQWTFREWASRYIECSI